jgi:hypothetical protein
MMMDVPARKVSLMALVQLPDDIFRYVLFPMMPRADRVELNRALPRSHRVVGKLGKKVLEFELLLTTYKMKHSVVKCVTMNDIPVKREAILDFVRAYKSYAILFQYSHRVRCDFVRRVNFLIDHDPPTYKTEDYMTELKRLRAEIFAAMLRDYPYKEDMIYTNGNLPSY